MKKFVKICDIQSRGDNSAVLGIAPALLPFKRVSFLSCERAISQHNQELIENACKMAWALHKLVRKHEGPGTNLNFVGSRGPPCLSFLDHFPPCDRFVENYCCYVPRGRACNLHSSLALQSRTRKEHHIPPHYTTKETITTCSLPAAPCIFSAAAVGPSWQAASEG